MYTVSYSVELNVKINFTWCLLKVEILQISVLVDIATLVVTMVTAAAV